MKQQTAEEAKQLAMELVFEHADDVWKRRAKEAVIETARLLPFLTSDDVMERIPHWATTHEPRALGPIMSNAAKEGVIEKSDKPTINSRRRSRHAAPLTIWKSLLFKEKK